MDPILLFDGECGFCNRSVQLILSQDRRATLRFASLQGEWGKQTLLQHPELAAVDSIVFLDGAQAFVRSAAVLRIAAYLGGVWRLALMAYLLPQSWRDRCYDLIARNRHRLADSTQCSLPTPATRSRFLD